MRVRQALHLDLGVGLGTGLGRVSEPIKMHRIRAGVKGRARVRGRVKIRGRIRVRQL